MLCNGSIDLTLVCWGSGNGNLIHCLNDQVHKKTCTKPKKNADQIYIVHTRKHAQSQRKWRPDLHSSSNLGYVHRERLSSLSLSLSLSACVCTRAPLTRNSWTLLDTPLRLPPASSPLETPYGNNRVMCGCFRLLSLNLIRISERGWLWFLL